MDKTLIIIAGPTAVGKTDTALWLAQKLNTEVISADSRQIFKEMQIGTARPKKEELNGIPHYFLGNKSVKDYFNAYMYETEALQLLEKLFRKYDVLIMVGGSGLYIDAIVNGIDEIPTVIPQIRNAIFQWYKQQGLGKIQALLQKLDPEYYKKADINNPMRILKALEITIQANRPYSSFLTGKAKKRPFKIIMLGLDMPRYLLYERINKRVDQMIEQGLVEEAKQLLPMRHYTALNTVGYKEIFDYLDGKISLSEAVDLIKRNTRKYARRQLTWFRRYKQMKWFNPMDKTQIWAWLQQQLTGL